MPCSTRPRTATAIARAATPASSAPCGAGATTPRWRSSSWSESSLIPSGPSHPVTDPSGSLPTMEGAPGPPRRIALSPPVRRLRLPRLATPAPSARASRTPWNRLIAGPGSPPAQSAPWPRGAPTAASMRPPRWSISTPPDRFPPQRWAEGPQRQAARHASGCVPPPG